MENSNLNSRLTIRKQEINIREVLDFFWRLKYWIIISLAITVGIAIIYLRMLTPIYERTTWLMMNRDEGKNTEMYLLTDYQGKATSKKNDSELFSELYVLKSPTIMSKVVSELGINARYYKYIKPFGNSIAAMQAEGLLSDDGQLPESGCGRRGGLRADQQLPLQQHCRALPEVQTHEDRKSVV